VTAVDTVTAHREALHQLRVALGELLGAERRLRGREQQQPRELTNSQLRALLVLDKEDSVTAGDLARSAELNPASVTAMLDLLESKGIVERKRDSRDRRVCMVSLTASGREIVGERRATWQALWDQRFGDLSDDELLSALGVLKRMVEILDEI
jgi:DNA-binding MarR family transcriptional regulator